MGALPEALHDGFSVADFDGAGGAPDRAPELHGFRVSGELVTVWRAPDAPRQYVGLRERKAVWRFSESSAWRMRRYLRECVSDYRVMLTLTYPADFPEDGELVKRQLHSFFVWLRRHCEQHAIGTEFQDVKFSAFWFLEFQKRGAPHIHVFITHPANHHAVALRWFNGVGSDDDRHLRAGTRIEWLKKGRSGVIAYASKYAAKQSQKVVPEWFDNVGRFWGVRGCRETVSADTMTDENMRKNARVQANEDAIMQLLANGLKRGRTEVIYSKPWCRVLRVRNLATLAMIRGHIHMIEQVTASRGLRMTEVDDWLMDASCEVFLP